MTPELTQELKALLCPDGCGKGLPLNTCDDGRSHITPYGSNQVILCTANPAVIEWVEKQLDNSYSLRVDESKVLRADDDAI